MLNITAIAFAAADRVIQAVHLFVGDDANDFPRYLVTELLRTRDDFFDEYVPADRVLACKFPLGQRLIDHRNR